MSRTDSRADARDFEYPPGLRTSDRVYSYPSTAPLLPRSVQSNYPRSTPELEYGFGIDDNWSAAAPNRHTSAVSTSLPFSSFNHNHLPPDRDPLLYRHQSPQSPSSPGITPSSTRSTLWWGELEPWMDEEYAKQVCGLMGWDPVNVKIPHPTPDPATGQQPNNPGYCFLTFPTPAHAASVLAQINSSSSSSPVTMPNSTRPFVLNWASSVPSAASHSSSIPSTVSALSATQQQYPKEYSIFVGDLAPETSNSDLVAVFRNPVLGLRNDREPKFIRPFLSCKSAKIMLDPVTGVSRGYGFVRFTEEPDQQRALIEMHGLYCLSRPMRISPATAKFKPPTGHDLSQGQFSSSSNGSTLEQPPPQPVTIALPLPSSSQTKSVSAPIAATPTSVNNNNNIPGSGSGSSLGGSNSTNSLTSGTSGSSASIASSAFISPHDDMLNLPNNVLAQIAQRYADGTASPTTAGGISSITEAFAKERQGQDNPAPRYIISEESWKHHAQARAILGNLIGPNGEQLTSTDPYNTTVFVGGLSPLISEETLRTFFAPFGDIHYVKVPIGKHCGFVQFVRKADAERAIEKMQGFPVGGSRIRLSWGRSQYKAAQAAAQAAQAAALQSQSQSSSLNNVVTPEQAYQLLQKFGIHGLMDGHTGADANNDDEKMMLGFSEEKLRPSLLPSRDDSSSTLPFDTYGFGGRASRSNSLETRQSRPSFAPFSPEANLFLLDHKRLDPLHFPRGDLLPHPSRSYAPGFGPSSHDSKGNAGGGGTNSSGKVSPSTVRPSSASRYGSFLDGSPSTFPMSRAPGRPEASISRPTSGNQEQQEHDMIQDLNGTLASLDLDSQGQGWKAGSEGQFKRGVGSHVDSPSP